MNTQRIFRAVQAHETGQAAHIHRAAMAAFDWYNTDLHTEEEDRAFYRDIVAIENVIDGAFCDEQLLGFLARNGGWISHLYVNPSCQSQGIGSDLLARAKVASDDLQLWTFQSNSGACRFYERHGFDAEEFTDGTGNAEKLPDVRYHWKRIN